MALSDHDNQTLDEVRNIMARIDDHRAALQPHDLDELISLWYVDLGRIEDVDSAIEYAQGWTRTNCGWQAWLLRDDVVELLKRLKAQRLGVSRAEVDHAE